MDDEIQAESKLASACCFVVLGFGFLVLFGWLMGMPRLTGLGQEFPMAPSTALSFLLIGSSTFLSIHHHSIRLSRLFGSAALLVVGIFSLLEIIQFAVGEFLDLEAMLVPSPGTFGNVMAGRMSPISAMCFVLSTVAAGLLWWTGLRRSISGNVASVLGWILVLANTVLILGYLNGAPLLYGGTIVPVALSTALAFEFLGATIILASGADNLPLRLFTGKSARAILLRNFVPLSILLVIGADLLLIYVRPRVEIDPALLTAVFTVVAMLVTGTVIFQVAGKIGSSIDRAEAGLIESEERHRSLVENARDAILVLELEGNGFGSIISANQAGAEMHGYTLDEIVTLNITDLDTPESAERIPTRIQRIMNGETVREVTTHRKKDGTVFPIEINPRMIELGNHKYIMSMDRDVTEREESRAALQASEERMRTIINSSPIGITIIQDKRYAYVNASFIEMFEYANADEILGQRVESLFSSEYRDMILNVLEEGTKGRSHHFEVSGLKKGEHVFEVATWLITIDYQGRPGTLAFLVDITESKSLRTQLLQAQKMEAVGTLAGGIAHDFNNLLQAVLGYTELMLQRKKEGEKDYSDLQKIYQAGERGADLVKSLMTFSRKIETKYVPVNLNQEITRIQSLLSRTIPKTIKIDLHLSGDLESIQSDPSQLGQVLMNLGVNARDAMPDGGTLTFETTSVELDEEYCRTHFHTTPGRYVLLIVSDTGQGMDKETLVHIFEPFFSTKEAGKGTGLGLSTVYGIVKQHEGHIMCYSEPGHGTTFKIYLPTIETKKDLETPIFETAIPGGTETVLLVDDEEDLRDLATTILNRFGYKVITAGNGKEALEIYQREGKRISLVILDLIMPEMDGRQCLAEMLRIDPNAKVLIASGYSESGPANGAVATGAKGFVDKPYNMRKLLTAVREVLDEN